MPPPAAIERQMEGMGVTPKAKERARQTFMKSAIFAGFLDPSSGRFIKPGNVGGREEPPPPKKELDGENGGKGGGGSDDDLNLDPLLIALLKKIPGQAPWPAAQRIRWFRTFAMNVSQIYDADDAPVEMEIKAQKIEEE